MFLVINHIIVAINDSMLLQQQLPGKTHWKIRKKGFSFLLKNWLLNFPDATQKKGISEKS